MTTKATIKFYALVKYDYQADVSGPFDTYDEAAAFGVDKIEKVGAWSFTIEKRWVREGKERA